MPNVFLSGRIPAELNQQIEEFLARTGQTKTEMLAKAVAAYIGVEAPPLKATGDRRMENVEQKIAELEGAIKSLYEKIAALTAKIETPKVQLESVIAYKNNCDNNNNTADNSNLIENIHRIDYISSDIDENAVDSSDNYVENEKANTPDNNNDNDDNIPKAILPADVAPPIDEDKTFLNIETAEVAKLAKIPHKRFTSLRHSYNEKLKKENQSLPEKKKLDSPIKMTPASGVKIEKVPYDIFYVGHSEEGRNLWNLVPITTVDEDIPLPFFTDNNK